jgi:peroxiredoxin
MSKNMEKNNEINVGRWVDDRLRMLTPPEDWQPDLAAGLARLERGRDAGSTWSRRWAWAPASAAAVICICALAFPVTRVFAQRCVNACVVETSFAGRFLWKSLSGSNRLPGGVAGISERRTAPDFTLADVSGKSVRLSEFRGQVVLLNFWATWCGPCKVEIPWFVEFQRAYRDGGFAVLGVSLDQDGWKSVKPYIEERNVNYRVMVGGEEIAQIYDGLESLPTTLMIDRAGRIAVTHVGLVEKKTYEEELKALIAER